jgi:hypothetical protein
MKRSKFSEGQIAYNGGTAVAEISRRVGIGA